MNNQLFSILFSFLVLSSVKGCCKWVSYKAPIDAAPEVAEAEGDYEHLGQFDDMKIYLRSPEASHFFHGTKGVIMYKHTILRPFLSVFFGNFYQKLKMLEW